MLQAGYVEVEAPSKVEVQADLAAAISTKRILINKQKKRQFGSGRLHVLLQGSASKLESSNTREGDGRVEEAN